MARKRRIKKTRKKGGLKIQIKSSVLREIWAIIHVALAIFTYLSLGNNFGVIGELWMAALRPLLGWGVNAMPFVFTAFALMFFFARELKFTLARIMGMIFLVVAVLSILHLSVQVDALYSQAQAGNYGGYVGFVTNFIFRVWLNVGTIGATVIYLAVLLISLLLTFEISVMNILVFLKPDIRIVRKHDRQFHEEDEEIIPVRKKVTDDDEALKELNNEDELDEDELERGKYHLAADDGHVVTIKRPIIDNSLQQEAKSRKIHVIKEEEDIVPEVTTEIVDNEYADWEAPSLDLLNPAVADIESDDALLQENARKIREKLKQFGITVDMHEVHVGPTVIQYTLRPDEGIKLSKITGLKNDLALALASKSIRIEAPIPGKSLVGIEVPNDHRSLVHLRELLDSKEYKEIDSNLRLPLGRDVAGKPVCADLSSMPHLLVAGATGSGKSVGMNTFLLSMIYQNSPADLKFIMIDPKRVELNTYNGIPHLLTPVVTDPEKAAIALRWAVAEMNRRYMLCSETGHRNITEYNSCRDVHEEGRELPGHNKMPNIVIVIDELADLMMAAGKEVEASICRIAQMARAVGMHLIVATQRPSVDVITGLIKANIPARIAFAVSSSVDSRTILDGIGAEDLLGKGDMLYLPGGMNKPLRVQGIFVSSKEIERVTNKVKISAPPNYMDEILSPKVAQQRILGIPESELGEMDDDQLYQQALEVIRESRKASASLLQRRLKVGYARAARLLDLMEESGVIGPVNGAKAREIYLE